MKHVISPGRCISRGAAAVEFALTLPLILAFLGGLVTFFSVAHARGQLLDLVGNVTRGCGMLAVNHGNVSDCAQSLSNILIAAVGCMKTLA
ncbi:MAG: pilus assembly protein [Cytophagaceae bacterium]|nr:MAG: pilus assembly protein [Cytophagaceae bacterium]